VSSGFSAIPDHDMSYLPCDRADPVGMPFVKNLAQPTSFAKTSLTLARSGPRAQSIIICFAPITGLHNQRRRRS